MNLPDTLLDAEWYWAAWAAWVPLILVCLRQAPWGRLKSPEHSNLWLGSIVVLVLLWSLKAGVKPGLTLHLLGATAMTLSLGPQLAIIGLAIVQAGAGLNAGDDWQGFALAALLTSGVGVAASWLVYRAVDRWLPKNFFIYVFVNAFFGSAVALIAVGLAVTSFLAAAGAYPMEYLAEEYLPYYLLLGFAEAWLSGMVMTLLIVYRPGWVVTFDDKRYLAGK